MHPILFRIPLPGWNFPVLGHLASLPIYSYGVMLGLSLVVGWYLTLGLAERDGFPVEEMANCYVVTALVALVSARLLYVATNPEEFKTIGDWFAVRRGGLVAYGGFLGGAVASIAYLKWKRLPVMPWGDVVVPSLASGLMLTRIGCYLYGCDFGKPLGASAPGFLKRLGTFPQWPSGTVDAGAGSPAWSQHVERHLVGLDAPASLPVHPTQIYESLVGLALLLLVFAQRRHQTFRGQVLLLFTFAYGVLRYGLEILRDDAERGDFGPMLPEHVLVPGGLIVLGLAFAIGMARTIVRPGVRVAAQIAAFVPGLALYFAMRPPSFAEEALVKLSTSQVIALVTGALAAVLYGIFYDAARARPDRAMAMGLERYHALHGSTAEAIVTSEPVEVEPPSRPRKRRKKRPVSLPPVDVSSEEPPDVDHDTSGHEPALPAH